ncbi:hypothetical protein E4T46_04423 [Aureobasidium subglaciale]|nr:hypothetical protein E4T41_04537 [Aureobasidium subglaciale]KAI5262518.1 hypothetical protein E4T46_04423 [Aureobasidium subglaciale]
MSHPTQGHSTSQSNSARSTPQPPANLPARPPPSAVSQPARNVAAFSGFKPRNVAAPVSAAPAPYAATNMSYPAQYSAAPASQSYYPPTYSSAPAAPAAQSYYAGASYPGAAAYPAQPQYADTPPQIKNPFAPPPAAGQGSLYGNGSYDPELEAQIQQWQSAYTNKDDPSKAANKGATVGNANNIPLGVNRAQPSTSTVSAGPVAPVDTSGKQKTVLREGGGQKWEDPTLLEWGDHPRLFVGNLAGEVTDESLLKAFAKYPSVQKARVIRDKRTTKSKGFGFVSLANTDEFFQAAKEMQGKYIGSHPVLIKRAETEIKTVVKKDNNNNNKYNKNNKNKNNKDKVKEDKGPLGANTGAGIQKKQTKAPGGGQFKIRC